MPLRESPVLSVGPTVKGLLVKGIWIIGGLLGVYLGTRALLHGIGIL